ncbi:MAG TPA: hypothetical protein VIM02_01750 [Rhizomicrobium sp.]|jgi:hypothetical protein
MEKLFDHFADWLGTASDPIKLGFTAVVFLSLTLAGLGFYRFVWREPAKPVVPAAGKLKTPASFVTFLFPDNSSVTIDMHAEIIRPGDQQVHVQIGTYAPASGGSVGFTVYVAYAGSPWRFGKSEFDHPEVVDRIFNDSVFINQLRSKDALICVGLESYRDARPISAYKPTLSQERAHSLCAFVVRKLKAQNLRPLILGVGLGKDVNKSTRETDLLQRPLIVLGIDDKEGYLKESEERLEMVSAILTSGALVGFTASDYSVVREGEPLCWIQMSKSETTKPACVDPAKVRSVTSG